VLQFGLLIVGLIVYWPLRSSTAGIAALVLLAATANVVLAVTERLRTSSVRAALAAGEKPRGPRGSAAKGGAGGSAGAARDDRTPKARPRGGRKRKRK